jgi:hypothetical protein
MLSMAVGRFDIFAIIGRVDVFASFNVIGWVDFFAGLIIVRLVCVSSLFCIIGRVNVFAIFFFAGRVGISALFLSDGLASSQYSTEGSTSTRYSTSVRLTSSHDSSLSDESTSSHPSSLDGSTSTRYVSASVARFVGLRQIVPLHYPALEVSISAHYPSQRETETPLDKEKFFNKDTKKKLKFFAGVAIITSSGFIASLRVASSLSTRRDYQDSPHLLSWHRSHKHSDF